METCQKDIRDLRFELEFQMREFNLNLNECFHYCNLDTSDNLQCVIRCFNIHQTMMEKISNKINREYDRKIDTLV